MSIKPLLSFSTGELDPILHDRITLEKFNKGLDTARNVMINKTGSILSRFSTTHLVKSKNDGENIKILSLPRTDAGSSKVIEFGPSYLRVHNVSLDLYRGAFSSGFVEVATTFTSSDLLTMHFVVTGNFVYIFIGGKVASKFDFDNNVFVSNFFDLDTTISKVDTVTITPAGGPTGYQVDYAIALVFNGEELVERDLTALGSYNKPDATGQSNTLNMTLTGQSGDLSKLNQVRIYRRPNGGGAFGFLGITNNFTVSGSDITCSYIDLGGLADFTNGVIDVITKEGLDGVTVGSLNIRTGTVYQQRLLVAPTDYDEVILASRPGYKDNFYRDFPYDADSALSFKSGTEGNGKILRMIDKDGLVVFTTKGIYVSLGLLSIDNLGLEKKDSRVIDETIPPLAVPGGVFFVDQNTNNIHQFVFNDAIGTYQTLEHTIFSNHLFQEKRITSWAYQDGVNPLIIVTFDDGTFATFTYHFEHQMRAWTRHDSKYPVEQVEGTELADTSYFVVNKDGNRYITASLPRKIVKKTGFPQYQYKESDKFSSNHLMDATESTRGILNDNLSGTDVFVLTPVTPGDWEGNLTLTCGTSGLFPDPGSGSVGRIHRFFDENDGSVVNLEVVARTSDNEITVKPSSEFPSEQASGFNLYFTSITLSGLDHLEGEEVAVVVDGAVIASPYNDEETYKTITVTGGSITLDEEDRGAILIVGRPIAADTKTLNISTVEQKRSQIESQTVNKLYIKVNETRGLYVSDRFPEENTGGKDGNSVAGMEDMDLHYVPCGEEDILVNRYKKPVSKRIEKTIPGNWKGEGQIAIRQVDPVHFEILSIIPDTEVEFRSDR